MQKIRFDAQQHREMAKRLHNVLKELLSLQETVFCHYPKSSLVYKAIDKARHSVTLVLLAFVEQEKDLIFADNHEKISDLYEKAATIEIENPYPHITDLRGKF